MFRHQLSILSKAVWTSLGVTLFLVTGSTSVQAASIIHTSFAFGDASDWEFSETSNPATDIESPTQTDVSTLNITNAPVINASSYNGATIIANTTLKISNNSTLGKKINVANGVNVTLEGGNGKSVTIQDSSFAENSNVTLGGSSTYFAAPGSTFKGNITISENASFGIGSASATENNSSNAAYSNIPQPLTAMSAAPASFQNGYSAQNDTSVLNQAGVIDVNGNVRIDGRLIVNVKNGQVDAINVEGEIGLGENFKFVVMVDSYEDYAMLKDAVIMKGTFDDETMAMLEDVKSELQKHLETNGEDLLLYMTPEGALALANAAMVPEPTTWSLLILGFLGLGFLRKRK